VGMLIIKLRIGRESTLVVYRKLRYFSITLRLQRLFMSSKTTENMTCHHSYDAINGVMVRTLLMMKTENILIGCILNF